MLLVHANNKQKHNSMNKKEKHNSKKCPIIIQESFKFTIGDNAGKFEIFKIDSKKVP